VLPLCTRLLRWSRTSRLGVRSARGLLVQRWASTARQWTLKEVRVRVENACRTPEPERRPPFRFRSTEKENRNRAKRRPKRSLFLSRFSNLSMFSLTVAEPLSLPASRAWNEPRAEPYRRPLPPSLEARGSRRRPRGGSPPELPVLHRPARPRLRARVRGGVGAGHRRHR